VGLGSYLGNEVEGFLGYLTCRECPCREYHVITKKLVKYKKTYQDEPALSSYFDKISLMCILLN
jgi:hypothetical protein